MSVSASIMRKTGPNFVLCIETGEYEGELVLGKVYRVVRPERNDPLNDLRVVDESGEDYLYPAKWFVPVELPPKAKRVLTAVQ